MVPAMLAESSDTGLAVVDAKPQRGSANRKAAAKLTVEGMSFVLLVLGRLRGNYARFGKTGNIGLEPDAAFFAQHPHG
jgi:hypothetical protein